MNKLLFETHKNSNKVKDVHKVLNIHVKNHFIKGFLVVELRMNKIQVYNGTKSW